MSSHSLQISQHLRNKVRLDGAEAWLRDLPALVADLMREWSITVGRALEGAHEAFVAEATMEDGTPAVLKVLVPRSDDVAKHEITALRLADGEGCARLYRANEAASAMLIERLGRTLFDLHLPLERRLAIMCDSASGVWRPAQDSGLPTGAEKGRWLIGFIVRMWDETGRPCSERAIAHAVACAERRIAAHDDERSVLVHGDVHQWNTLEAGEGFKLIDPDGLLAEAEYDLGVLLRGDPVELMQGDPMDRARWLAARTGLDATAAWEWGAVERVSSGLLCHAMKMQPEASQMLEAAESVATTAAKGSSRHF
jgi:streptomycin 6-kinase